MAHRRIDIPADIEFVDNETEEPIKDGKLSFWQFLDRVFGNPGWNESYKHGMAMAAIRKAARRARRDGDSAFLVADGDYELLKGFVENPKYLIPGTSTLIPGFGYQPMFADQIVPFQLVIIDAPRDLEGPRKLSDVDTAKPLIDDQPAKKNGKRTPAPG